MDATICAALLAARERSARTNAAWRTSAAYRAATDAFAGCPGPDNPAGAPEAATARAEALLADGGWVEALLAPLVTALAGDPFFEPPFKVHRDALRIGAVLFDCPAASIAASVTRASAMAALPPPATIVFTGRVSITRTIRAGGAHLARWWAEPIDAQFRADEAPQCTALEPIALRDGMLHRTDGRREAQLIRDAAGDVVTLVATIRAGAAPLLREYDRASRALLRVGDGDDRPSRIGMLLHLLRVAGRTDASPCFAAATEAPQFHLRWAAMREWLALDAAAALPRLATMARSDAHAEVRAAATRMLPVVAQRLAEAARCPG
ncbi:hypothetical protein FHS95_003057 [Sphingomonas naasensis]|uniref:HEAT repeat domain-containing protein n=1 Tax=Sphingomonas naasensis TaxID=1344951 RepID=A0A4V3QVI4_9SPHN|nr:hypothetical protein [Sphingomonas naasensis]NIJ21354.1 hypothetical protein [Sphingomonas naasensis]TGX38782.1 hypothetical protein E5A74_18320 [Sphingomonas naasensis]